MAAIIEYDMEAIWDFESKLLVTNSPRFPNIENIYFEVNTVSLWQLEAKLKKCIFVACRHFFTAETVKMALGGHVIQKFHC